MARWTRFRSCCGGSSMKRRLGRTNRQSDSPSAQSARRRVRREASGSTRARATRLSGDLDAVRWRLRLPGRTRPGRTRMGDRGCGRSAVRGCNRAPRIRSMVSRRDRISSRSSQRQERRGGALTPREPSRREGAIRTAYAPRFELHRDHRPIGVQREALAVGCLLSITVVPQACQFVRESSAVHGP